jgi:hypothetical protein
MRFPTWRRCEFEIMNFDFDSSPKPARIERSMIPPNAVPLFASFVRVDDPLPA